MYHTIMKRTAYNVGLLLLLVFLLSGILLHVPHRATASNLSNAGEIFALSELPEGIAMDAQGNVFVNSMNPDNVFQNLFSLFRPDGSVLQQHTHTIPNSMRLVYDEQTGLFIGLWDNGDVFTLDTQTMQITSLLSLKELEIDTQQIFDVTTGSSSPMAGLINPEFATYGDIALLRRSTYLDLFVTGVAAAGTYDFVMRVRLFENSYDARVLVSTGATEAPYDSIPPGIAVNQQGTVLTTLPVIDDTIYTPYLIRFSADFPEEQGTCDPNFQPGCPQVIEALPTSSLGMTSDAEGNFYLTTGSAGNQLCDFVPATMTVFSPDLSTYECYDHGIEGIASPLVSAQDIAVSPEGDVAYASIISYDMPTVYDLDAVVRYTLKPGAVQPIQLLLNYPTGQPGSFFTLSGSGFAPNTQLTLTINGTPMGSISTGSTGDFLQVLQTAISAAPGDYQVQVAEMRTSYQISHTAPLRAQEADQGTPLVTVPATIEPMQIHWLYAPLVQK